MPKTKLGGIKVYKKRVCFFHLCNDGGEALVDICSRIAGDRMNVGLLVHIGDPGGRKSLTAASMKSIDAVSVYLLGKLCSSECNVENTLGDACRISIFPHDQKPDVTASLLGLLADNGIKPYAIGSSPSAMTVIVSCADFKRTMERIFDVFSFHGFDSYENWQTAYGGQEESLLKNVRSSFHEEIITIYDFHYRTDMELWSVKLPLTDLGDFAGLLASLDRQIRMPFLASVSPSSETDIHFSLLFELAHHDRIEQSLARNLPGFDTHCHGPSAIFFLHGPHFGDRYGIVNALVKALHKTGIDLLALSCAVSSISLVVPANESDRTIQALNSVFQTPTGQLKN